MGKKFFNFEFLAFSASATAFLSGAQLDGTSGALPLNLFVQGAASPGTVETLNVTAASLFSAAGWSFTQWNSSEDVININGSTGNDTITGSSQIDRIAGGGGNDIINGGAAVDTAVFAGVQATYAIQRIDITTWLVADADAAADGNDGADTLANIEKLNFVASATTINVADLIGTLSDNNAAADSVAEGAPSGTVVGIIGHAVDGTGQTVVYTLADSAGGRFQIDVFSGVVTVANGTLLDFETGPSQNIVVRASSADGSFTDKVFTIGLTDANDAPTAVSLANAITSLKETTSTAAQIKVADIVVTDDALGSEVIFLTGADAGSFEIVGTGLFLKAGTKLDFETKSSYSVAINVDDPSIGATPDATRPYTLHIGNVSPETITGTGSANTLVGSSDKDRIFGLGGNDKLLGNANADTLTGGLGRDIMTGGSGNDIFDFNKVSETGKSSTTRDRITDFTHGRDDIDLKTIDANGSASGNGTFKFVAKEGANFTGVKGQLIWDRQDHSGTTKDVTIVSGDTNGDKHTDFQIELSGLKTLTSGDFIL